MRIIQYIQQLFIKHGTDQLPLTYSSQALLRKVREGRVIDSIQPAQAAYLTGPVCLTPYVYNVCVIYSNPIQEIKSPEIPSQDNKRTCELRNFLPGALRLSLESPFPLWEEAYDLGYGKRCIKIKRFEEVLSWQAFQTQAHPSLRKHDPSWGKQVLPKARDKGRSGTGECPSPLWQPE